MNTNGLVVTSLALAFASGCVSQIPVRASAQQHAAADKLRVEVYADVGRVTVLLSELLAQDGFKLVNTVDSPNQSKIYVFKGRRTSVTTVRANSTMIHAESNEIGSWFAVRVKREGDKTSVAIIGKPTVRNVEVCSDDDASLADVQYWCQDTKVREDYPRLDLLNGRAEAEEITGLLERLKMKLAG